MELLVAIQSEAHPRFELCKSADGKEKHTRNP